MEQHPSSSARARARAATLMGLVDRGPSGVLRGGRATEEEAPGRGILDFQTSLQALIEAVAGLNGVPGQVDGVSLPNAGGPLRSSISSMAAEGEVGEEGGDVTGG
eukprot:CAMPEP_0196576150 /NCGR_PEP_ID=MMETSP1081-20130531/5488_1 /TAXON_ID=36882 /ORGANISM="Pyramimonas amylifera, Strain CCMP720" /LENGTH=104 /DNA_ID=CAMNT_0041894681 /DNA_START=321 /DNA_END=631 /DNA_ORIENTATION=-